MADRPISVDVVDAAQIPTNDAPAMSMPKGFDDVVPPTDPQEFKVVQTKTQAPAGDDEIPEIPRPDNPIKLSNPILINGMMRNELAWTDEITADQFLEADNIAHSKRVSFNVAELDTSFNFAVGEMMIVAANHEIDVKDLEQVRGRDIMKIMRIGRFFTNQSGA